MGINEKLERIEAKLDEQDNKAKPKKFNLPAKGKVSNAKMKHGYATVIEFNENRNIDFLKIQIVDGTIKLDDTFHALKADEVFFYKGKPVIFQPKNKLNPYNPLKGKDGKHETYGQKYVMARMEGDKLSLKKKIGWGMGIGILVIIGIIAYSVLGGG